MSVHTMAASTQQHDDAGPLELVSRYAAAKSRQDIASALAVCSEDFVLDTVPFGTRAVGTATVTAQLQIFFATFPDYRVTVDGQAVSEDGAAVTCWGTWRATMRGAFGAFDATGRECALPFACVFEVAGSRLAAERFFFDLGTMCEQLGLPLDVVARQLRAFRAMQGSSDPLPPTGTMMEGSAVSAAGPAPRVDATAADFVARFADFWRPPVDLAKLDSLLHPDVRLVAPGMEPTVGRAAGMAAFRNVFAMTPDLHLDVERWRGDADVVFIEVTLRGTLNGRVLAIPGVDRILLRDGMVLERVAYFDPSPMLAALSAPA